MEGALKKLRQHDGLVRSEELKSHARIILPNKVHTEKVESSIVPFRSNNECCSITLGLIVRPYQVEETYDLASKKAMLLSIVALDD